MSFHNGHGNKLRNNKGNREKHPNEDQAANNPFLQDFLSYSFELDSKHDRHEKLVKLSRDVTIESKRIIFLLHNIDSRKNNKQQILQEAKERLDKVLNHNFRAVAKELTGHEIYLYQRAVSAGIQEFIEALTFHEYLSDSSQFTDWENLQPKLHYESETNPEAKFSFPLIPGDFLLGYADLTGEVMRYCVNSLGSGDTENCFKTCSFLQKIYANFLKISAVPNHGRDFAQKISTMRSSTLKTEHVCYNLIVRGSEQGGKFLPLMSLDMYTQDCGEDVDEGYY